MAARNAILLGLTLALCALALAAKRDCQPNQCGCHECGGYSNCGDCTSAPGCAWCTGAQQCVEAYDNGVGSARLCDPTYNCDGCLRWANFGNQNPGCPRSTSFCGNYTNCGDCTSNLGCSWCTSSRQCLDAYDNGVGSARLCNGNDACDGCLRWTNFNRQNANCPADTTSCSNYTDCGSCTEQLGCAWCSSSRTCRDAYDNGVGSARLCNQYEQCGGCLRWTNYGKSNAPVCPKGSTACSDYSNCADCTSQAGCSWCTEKRQCLDAYDNGVGSARLCNPDDGCAGCLNWANIGKQPARCPQGKTFCSDYHTCGDCTANLPCAWCTSTRTCLDAYDNGVGSARLCNPADACDGCLRWADFGNQNPRCPKSTSSCAQYSGASNCGACTANFGCAWCTNTTACLDAYDNGVGSARVCNPAEYNACTFGNLAWTDYNQQPSHCPSV